MKNKYRIIFVGFPVAHYEVQIKRWWLPFWYQVDFVNIHFGVEEAEQYIERHKEHGSGKVVKTNL